MITKEEKNNIFQANKIHKTDTGSTQIQVAVLTARINNLQKHINVNKKDYSSDLGLKKMVSLRKRLLLYLKRKSPEKYKNLIEKLDLRK